MKIFKYLLIFSFFLSVLIFNFSKTNLFSEERLTAKCKNISQESSKLQCYKTLIEDNLKRAGLKSTFNLTSKLYNEDLVFSSNCHDFMHLLGASAYIHLNTVQDKDIVSESSICAFGFYHGFMETLISRGGSLDSSKEFCERVSKALNYQRSDPGDCFHGVGHGTSLMYEEEIKRGEFKKVLSDSFKICEQVSAGNDLLSCVNGVVDGDGAVLVENYSGEDVMPHPSNLINLCSDVINIYKEACYTGFSWYTLNFFDGDLKKSTELAKNLVEKQYLKPMIKTLVEGFMIYNKNFSGEAVSMETCDQIDSLFEEDCIRGLISAFMHFDSSQFNSDSALKYCNQGVTEFERSICFDQIFKTVVLEHSNIDLNLFCTKVPSDYRENCMKVVEVK